MDEKWRKWEEDLKMRHQEELDAALHELRAKMLTEKTAEKASLIKEHQKQIQLMTREHKRDMEAITRRFSSAAADIERLKKALEELKDVQTEMEDLKVNKITCFGWGVLIYKSVSDPNVTIAPPRNINFRGKIIFIGSDFLIVRFASIKNFPIIFLVF